MKIWQTYGSEHSMNLVMIGHFSRIDDAVQTKKTIDNLKENLLDKISIEITDTRYSDSIRDLLLETENFSLSQSEIEHWSPSRRMYLEGDTLILVTDQLDVSGFFKLMIRNGGKVEIVPIQNCSEEGILKLIGHFQSKEDAKKAKRQISELTDGIRDQNDDWLPGERYSDDVRKVLEETNCFFLCPSELEGFVYEDTITSLKDKRIILRTDEIEVSAFLKLMLRFGAKVEVFSRHSYPDEEG